MFRKNFDPRKGQRPASSAPMPVKFKLTTTKRCREEDFRVASERGKKGGTSVCHSRGRAPEVRGAFSLLAFKALNTHHL